MRRSRLTGGLGDGLHEERVSHAELDALVGGRELVEAEVDAVQQVVRGQHDHRAEQVTQSLDHLQSVRQRMPGFISEQCEDESDAK